MLQVPDGFGEETKNFTSNHTAKYRSLIHCIKNTRVSKTMHCLWNIILTIDVETEVYVLKLLYPRIGTSIFSFMMYPIYYVGASTKAADFSKTALQRVKVGHAEIFERRSCRRAGCCKGDPD